MTKHSNVERNELYFRFETEDEARSLIRDIASHYGSSVIDTIAECSTIVYLPVKGERSARMRRSGATHVLCVVALSQGFDRATKSTRWDVTVKSHACHNGRMESRYTVLEYWK